MGVAEMSMVATAGGLAVAGKVPFASTFAIFMAGRALESVRTLATHEFDTAVFGHGEPFVGDASDARPPSGIP